MLARQWLRRHLGHLAVDLDRGRELCREEQVTAIAADQQLEQVVDEFARLIAFHGAGLLGSTGKVFGDLGLATGFGGRDHVAFDQVGQALVQGLHAKAVILIGKDAPLIKEAIAATNVKTVDATDLTDAVNQAEAMAQSGDVVLLSPACASFDMFKDYGHRAQVFVDAVNELAVLRGQVSA